MPIEFECVADGVRLFSVGGFTGTRAECVRFIEVVKEKRAAAFASNPHEDTEPIDPLRHPWLPRGYSITRIGAVA